jgi:hypothetical protein
MKGRYYLNTKYHGGNMKAKPRRIAMTDEEDFELKLMTAAAGVSRATLIRQMVRALAGKLRTVQKEVGLSDKSTALVPTLIQAILLRDMEILSQEEYDQEISELVSYKDDVEF